MLDEADLRAAAERDLVAVWRLLSEGRADPAAGVEDHDGLVLTSTGMAVAFFNGAFVTGDCAADEAVGTARDFFAARNLPYALRFPPERTDVAEMALAAGLRELVTLPLMALPIPVDLPRLPDGLEVEDVCSVDTLGRHAALLAAAFFLPVEVMTDFLHDLPLREERFTAYNAAIDGEPATCSAVFVDREVAGIYDVATISARRGRGLAEAMTWHAVRAGQARGARVAVLQPSPMGLPLYARMGFRTVAEWRQFSDDPRQNKATAGRGEVTPRA